MRILPGALMLAVVGPACSYPVETFEVGDGAVTDTSHADAGADVDAGVDATALDAPGTCSDSTPDLCGTVCTNLKTDDKNCGKCGRACQAGERCQVGGGGGSPRCN